MEWPLPFSAPRSHGLCRLPRRKTIAATADEDFGFLKRAQIKPLSLVSMAMGDSAMVSSRSEIRVSHEGVPMSMLSSEMLTLKQTPSGWKIVKVQWSSGPIPGA